MVLSSFLPPFYLGGSRTMIFRQVSVKGRFIRTSPGRVGHTVLLGDVPPLSVSFFYLRHPHSPIVVRTAPLESFLSYTGTNSPAVFRV